ncbi:MAG: DHHW family protein [Candidatus Bathyarchaeia archaeon]
MKNVNLVTIIVFITFIFGLTIFDLLKPPTEISMDERRKLAQIPEVSIEKIFDGTFAGDYAVFLQDQVVFRDDLRSLKAFIEFKLLRKKENNGVYVIGDDIYDKFYGINQHYLDRAAGLIDNIIGLINSDKVYLSIIPSKAHMLDRDEYLLSDQNMIADFFEQHTSSSYIDIMNLYEQGDGDLYYRTDHHWTTQGAIKAYRELITAMGYEPVDKYDYEEFTDTFVGSNYGKAASSSIEKDTIYLAHNEYLDNMSVCRYATADTFNFFNSIYFREKVGGFDPYDVFIGGAGPITVIENDRTQSDEELIIFKDSYSHALAPFLAQHFKTVTLYDLRYVRKELIFDNFDLTGKTILFLYSTTILNTDPQILN